MKRTSIFAAALLALVATGSAQNVGDQLGPVNLQEFAQTDAHSFDNFLGDAVLFEFFAYW